MEQTVNLPAMPTQVRILPPPSSFRQGKRACDGLDRPAGAFSAPPAVLPRPLPLPLNAANPAAPPHPVGPLAAVPRLRLERVAGALEERAGGAADRGGRGRGLAGAAFAFGGGGRGRGKAAADAGVVEVEEARVASPEAGGGLEEDVPAVDRGVDEPG